MKKRSEPPEKSQKGDIQNIAVFQQNNSGENKIRGIRHYGNQRFDLNVISVDAPLPSVIDDTADYLPPIPRDADLVLDFLNHPDLSHDLAVKCHENGIPMVASGKKMKLPRVFTPPV